MSLAAGLLLAVGTTAAKAQLIVDAGGRVLGFDPTTSIYTGPHYYPPPYQTEPTPTESLYGIGPSGFAWNVTTQKLVPIWDSNSADPFIDSTVINDTGIRATSSATGAVGPAISSRTTDVGGGADGSFPLFTKTFSPGVGQTLTIGGLVRYDSIWTNFNDGAFTAVPQSARQNIYTVSGNARYQVGNTYVAGVLSGDWGSGNVSGSVTTGHFSDQGGAQWWSYTLCGKTPETWAPRFSYYGFRYLQVQWMGGAARSGKVIAVRGRALRSDSDVVGSFQSSSTMLNRIHALILAAMHNNEMSLFTDCPHREKLGWLEETHLVAPGLMFNSNLQALYRATAQNIADAQKEDGMVPTIAPQYTMFGPKYAIYDDSPEWGSASILAAWEAYTFYGDADELQQNYPTMQRYLSYLQSRAKDGIVAYGLGDWYDIGPGEPGFEKNTTLGVTGTLMLYEDAATMQKIALLLGYADDATRYAELAEQEKRAFNARFWNPAAGYYDTGSQTANAMPLQLGIVPEERRTEVLQHIVADIRAHSDHVTTGEVGFPYLVRALMDNGRSDVMLALMLRTDPPSYGSQLAAGATSLTEAWDANPKNSQDHFMLGGGEEWLYRGLGGIDLDMSRAPSDRITIRPQIVKGVSWVRCGYTSTEGRIESDWTRHEGRTTMDVTIPAGAEANIIVPAHGNDLIKERGKLAQTLSYLKLIRRDTTDATYEVQSGSYHFSVTEAAQQ